MELARVVYYSENRIGLRNRSLQITALQHVAVNRNRAAGVTGALIHDELWFVQALEGERAAVITTFNRILNDPRHANVQIISKVGAKRRLFGDWSMGFAARTPQTEPLFGHHWFNKGMNPGEMSEKMVLDLMLKLAQGGFMAADNLCAALG